MSTKLITLIIVIVVVLLGITIYFSRDTNTTIEVQKTATVQQVTSTAASQKYVNGIYGFSFDYPGDFKVKLFEDTSTGTSIVFERGEQGFQIAISPFDEGGEVLTEARIKKDIPTIKISEPQDVLIGSRGKGIAFIGENTSFGKSREVWFVRGGYLYQLSAPLSFDSIIKSLLSTWQFEE